MIDYIATNCDCTPEQVKRAVNRLADLTTIYVNYKTQRVSDCMPGDMTDVDRYKFECDHQRVKMYSNLYRTASLEEPAEYTTWGVCTICGDTLDGDDVPEYAEEE